MNTHRESSTITNTACVTLRVSSTCIRGKKEYLVHWKGYPDSDDSWVKEEDIDGEIVEEYKMKLAQEGNFF